MRIVIAILCIISFSCFAQQEKNDTIKVRKVKTDTLHRPKGKVYLPSQLLESERPKYPGGPKAMEDFIIANTKSPDGIAPGYSGICDLTFIINEDGTISDIKFIRGFKNCLPCDQEVIRVLGLMPEWIPGKIAGTTIRVLHEYSSGFAVPR